MTSITNTPLIEFHLVHEKAAVLKGHEGDAGYDLVAIDNGKEVSVGYSHYYEYDTGVVIKPTDKSIFCFAFPRSSLSKTGYMLANSVGVIDTGYRGTVKCRFYPVTHKAERPPYAAGEKIIQIVPMAHVVSPNNVQVIVDASHDTIANSTTRGTGGFGSTGA